MSDAELSDAINKHACSAGCVYAHNLKGMSVNGGCHCLSCIDIDQRQQIRKVIAGYKERISELENELATLAIEEQIDEQK